MIKLSVKDHPKSDKQLHYGGLFASATLRLPHTPLFIMWHVNYRLLRSALILHTGWNVSYINGIYFTDNFIHPQGQFICTFASSYIHTYNRHN